MSEPDEKIIDFKSVGVCNLVDIQSQITSSSPGIVCNIGGKRAVLIADELDADQLSSIEELLNAKTLFIGASEEELCKFTRINLNVEYEVQDRKKRNKPPTEFRLWTETSEEDSRWSKNDVEIVMNQADRSERSVRRALTNCDGDIVNAIMMLIEDR